MNIADHAIGAAESPALIVADDGTVTYGELFERSQRVAALLHEAGLRRGDGVALVLPNRPEFFEITWGCQLSGLYYSAVNTHFTPDEVAYVIDDSEAKAVFVDESMAELAQRILEVNEGVDIHISVGGALPGWRSYSDALADGGDAPPISDGSEMLYSSGTTGRPKAVRRPLPEDGHGSWASEGSGVRARPALRHDLIERVPLPGTAVPRGGNQLHDGGPSGRCGLDPDAQVRR